MQIQKSQHEAGFFVEYGAPCRIRTCDHMLRRHVLYPTELRAHHVTDVTGSDYTSLNQHVNAFSAIFHAFGTDCSNIQQYAGEGSEEVGRRVSS